MGLRGPVTEEQRVDLLKIQRSENHLDGLVSDRRCEVCDGTRLRREARFVRVGGRSIVEASGLSIGDALAFFESLTPSAGEAEIASIMDCPEGTVYSRLHYARRLVQSHLERRTNLSGSGVEL